MAYDTKVIIKMMSRLILKAESLEEAYNEVKEAASVEDVTLPDYQDAKEAIQATRDKNKKLHQDY